MSSDCKGHNGQAVGIHYVLDFERDLFSEYGLSADVFPTLIMRFPEIFEPIAVKRNLTPFRAFRRSQPSTPDWFDAGQGLRTIRGYLEELRERCQKPAGKSLLPFIEALETIELVLAKADHLGVRFFITTPQERYLARHPHEDEETFSGMFYAGQPGDRDEDGEYEASIEQMMNDPRYHPPDP